MSILSREFTTREKVFLIILLLVIFGLGYYRFLDVPIRSRIASAEADRDAAQAELTVLEAQLARMQAMQDELDENELGGSYLASYNNRVAEIRLLNEILADTVEYTISFSDVTRSGDLIRRGITLQFTAPDFETMQKVIDALCDSEYRCLVGNIRCSMNDRDGTVKVDATATFFETMVDGVPDDGLPVDEEATY